MVRQAYYTISMFILAITSFFPHYFLSQKLTITEFGVFSLIYATIALIYPLMLFGQATSITSVYFSDEKKGFPNISFELYKAYKIMFLFSCISCVGVLIIWSLIYYQDYSFVFIMLFILASFFLALKTFFSNIIILFDRYKHLMVTSIISLIVMLIILLFFPSVLGYFFAVMASSFIFVVIGLYLHIDNSKLSVDKVVSSKELLILGWAAIPGMIIASLNTYVDRYTLNYFLDVESVAYYSLAATISIGIGTVVVNAILKANSVNMLQFLQDDNQLQYLKIQNISNNFLLSTMLISFIFYWFFGEFLVTLTLGVQYSQTINYILPLFIIAIFQGYIMLYSIPLVQKKKLYVLLFLSILTVIINIILNIALVNIFEIKGVIIAFFIATWTNFLLIYMFSKKYGHFLNFPWTSITTLCILEFFLLSK